MKKLLKRHQKMLAQAATTRNYEAMKRQEDVRSLLEYGFSNDAKLLKVAKGPRPPLSAGLKNFLKQVLP